MEAWHQQDNCETMSEKEQKQNNGKMPTTNLAQTNSSKLLMAETEKQAPQTNCVGMNSS